jgi:predicted transcriptional regulator
VTEDDGWKNQAKRSRTRVVTARLPVTLVGKVDRIATSNATSRTAIIEHSLEKFVDDQTAQVAVEGAPAAKSELFD